MALIKISQAGAGDLTLSYAGTLTGAANATVNGGTRTLTNRSPSDSSIDPRTTTVADSDKTVSTVSTEQTVCVIDKISKDVETAILLFGSVAETTVIQAAVNTDPGAGPLVTDVFSESFELCDKTLLFMGRTIEKFPL